MKIYLGHNIKTLRQYKDLTMQQLADKVKISRSNTIFEWEKGKIYPRLEQLILLSVVFQTPIDTLVFKKLNLSKEIHFKP